MYNTISAKKAGVKSTGNASRRGYNGIPGIGSHNFYITAGTQTPEEIIKKTVKGLLLKGVTGYGINPVKGITIAGSAESILMGIDMKGNDLDLNRRMTSPTLRIKEMQIGGE